jgi:uncharacterized protein (DUF1684 family)
MIDDPFSLWDYRRRVSAMYRRVRDDGVDDASWRRWRTERDALFSTHTESPIGAGKPGAHDALPFFPYDPAWRIEVPVESVEPVDLTAGHSGSGITPMVRFASMAFDAPPAGEPVTLSLYWIDVYGGGVFLPFRDTTNAEATYGGGRYLLDTLKGADLGSAGGRVVLDFNFAYHPSCVHDDRWSCPLAPLENRLGVAVAAGERLR